MVDSKEKVVQSEDGFRYTYRKVGTGMSVEIRSAEDDYQSFSTAGPFASVGEMRISTGMLPNEHTRKIRIAQRAKFEAEERMRLIRENQQGIADFFAEP